MAEVSLLRFLEEHDHDAIFDEIPHLDSFPFWSVGSGSVDRQNQVNFVIDLFHQQVEQSNLMDGDADDFVSEPVNDSSFGVLIEGNDLDLGLGLGLGLDEADDVDDDDDDNCGGGYIVSECGDEFYIASRESTNGLRVVRIESDSDEEDLLGIDVQSEEEEEEEDYEADNVNYDDAIINLFWDSLQLEDHVEEETNNDFEWEEIDGRVDEREVLADPLDEEESISVFPMSPPEEGEEGVEGGRGLMNLEWEVLLNVNHLDRNSDMVEYEMMFGQFTDGENVGISRPSASKLSVERLPSVVITEDDAMKERAICAVCKDHIEVGDKAKELPCSHMYHGDCILPWLEIRNTCPVCRYELPTDDPDYEQRRIRSATRVP